MAELYQAVRPAGEVRGTPSPEESRKEQEGRLFHLGEKKGFSQIREVLFEEEIFAGIEVMDIPKDPALERQYRMGFWRGVAEQINDHVKLTRSLPEEQKEGWKNGAVF